MNRAAPNQALYQRSELTADDARDLRDYLAWLRRYYSVPTDQPVFPPRPKTSRQRRRPEPSRGARNRADHPWRARLTDQAEGRQP